MVVSLSGMRGETKSVGNFSFCRPFPPGFYCLAQFPALTLGPGGEGSLRERVALIYGWLEIKSFLKVAMFFLMTDTLLWKMRNGIKAFLLFQAPCAEK